MKNLAKTFDQHLNFIDCQPTVVLVKNTIGNDAKIPRFILEIPF